MRVTEKGQVTIPKEIRERLGIVPGTEVDFVPSGNGALLVKAGEDASEERRRRFAEWADSVKGSFDFDGMTTDEYMVWLRGERDDLDSR
jgi:AbrB family looped-hinge helix DNA binding protein